MKFARFVTPDQKVQQGIVEANTVKVIKGSMFGDYQLTNEQYDLKDIKLLSPVEPSKILCIGLNYSDHAKEFGRPVPEEPILFIKPSTTVVGPKDDIIYPPHTQNLHYEAELAIVIGKNAKNVKKEDAFDYVFGYTVGNDITARDLQSKDGQWSRSKGFDTFCPLGPWVETDIQDPDDLEIKLTLNGEVRQHSRTNMLFFKCAFLIEYLSSVMTLLPGDVILTGTPAGIGSMQHGDVVEAYVEGIGTLVNQVIKP